jgi:hypothetical protein
MSAIKDCPQCGLVNPPTALQCDCGYNFNEQRPTRPYVRDTNPIAAGWIACVVLPPVGVVVGLIRMVQGEPSGAPMLALSLFVSVFWLVVGIALRFQ